jgi:hypothetical protein
VTHPRTIGFRRTANLNKVIVIQRLILRLRIAKFILFKAFLLYASSAIAYPEFSFCDLASTDATAIGNNSSIRLLGQAGSFSNSIAGVRYKRFVDTQIYWGSKTGGHLLS